ncbi:MAG TPA: SDR family NAD(P)-dependent oxidoreductase [Longimicrobiales bacterium]|nr:SDR family NAD(P)-dependent oxidoreductase [Longimicrobiales bacterium]
MNRIRGQRVLVTGASSGIGAACARMFASYGAALVLAARRSDRLDAVVKEVQAEFGVPVHARTLDVRDRDAVLAFGEWIAAEELVPDVLVNNAGLARGLDKLHEGSFADWDEMIDTNVKGLLNVTRAILPLMVARNRGHVVNIGSVAGQIVYPGGNVYNGSKFAVRAITQGMNLDLVGTNLRATVIEPGAVETEFSLVRFHGDEARAAEVYRGFQPLTAEDVADVVCYVVNAPPHVNIVDVIMMPTAQRSPFVLHRDETAREASK